MASRSPTAEEGLGWGVRTETALRVGDYVCDYEGVFMGQQPLCLTVERIHLTEFNAQDQRAWGGMIKTPFLTQSGPSPNEDGRYRALIRAIQPIEAGSSIFADYGQLHNVREIHKELNIRNLELAATCRTALFYAQTPLSGRPTRRVFSFCFLLSRGLPKGAP